MKILQVTAALEQGGVERGTVEMAAFIVSQRSGSFVASQGGRMVHELEEGGTKHFSLPLAKRNPLAIIHSIYQLQKLMRREKFDLVHARSRAPAWATFFACRLTGTKMVTTFHGTHRIQNSIKRYYNSIMVRGERVIAISDFIRQHILENYHVTPERIDIAPRGFDQRIFNPDLIEPMALKQVRDQFSLSQTEPVICLPGRLTRWKGQELFIKALCRIKDLSWQAIIVGGANKQSSYADDLKRLVEREGLSERVIFAGHQGNIVPFYAVSDVVVSASLEPEAFGRVAVEAQAMGVPVIASAHGGALETVRDGESGWLFPNGNTVILADKLRDALDSPERRRQFGKQARKWVWDNFTVDRMCAQEWDSYMKILL